MTESDELVEVAEADHLQSQKETAKLTQKPQSTKRNERKSAEIERRYH